jgi:hypothetical protein
MSTHGLGKDGWPSDDTVISGRDREITDLIQALNEIHIATVVNEGATAAEHLRLVRTLANDAIKKYYRGH